MAFPLTSDEVWSAVVARIGSEARAEQLTGETEEAHPNLDAAYLTALGIAKLKLGKRITWPPDELPAPFDFDVISLTIAIATAGLDRRPEWITNYEAAALKRFDDVATNKAAFPDTDADTSAGANLGDVVYTPPTEATRFNRDDLNSDLMRRKPPL